jgi:ABC-2 type transport system permease protein
MRAILLIGHNDLRLFLKHRASYVWLFGVPMLFICFMGFAFRGPGDPANARPTVLVENQDTNFLGAGLVRELGTQGLRVLGPTNAVDAPRGIRIPADFTARALSGQQARVEFFQIGNTVSGEGFIVELRLLRALVALNSQLLAASGRSGSVLTEGRLAEAQAAPPAARLDSHFAGRKPAPVGFSFSLPGNLVMYLMLNLLIFGGSALARDRQYGIVRRLAINPIQRGQVVAGKIYGLLLLGAAQVTVLLLAGRFLFGVSLGRNLPAIFLILLVYCWVAAALGVLGGSVIRAEDKVSGLCLMAALLMAALGGCWWPLEIGPPMLKTIAHCFPTGWAMDALHQLISFGGGFAEIRIELFVLTAFAITATALAARFFKWN